MDRTKNEHKAFYLKDLYYNLIKDEQTDLDHMINYKIIEKENGISKIERETQINRNLIYSDKYLKAIYSLQESMDCKREIVSASREILEHRNGTKFEDLYYIDTLHNNSVMKQINYDIEFTVKPTEKMEKALIDNDGIIALHNHPKSSLPSINDFHICDEKNYKYGLILCHNGTIYRYKTIGELNYTNISCSISIFDKEEYDSLINLQTREDVSNAHKEHITELTKNLMDAGVLFEEVLWNEK